MFTDVPRPGRSAVQYVQQSLQVRRMAVLARIEALEETTVQGYTSGRAGGVLTVREARERVARLRAVVEAAVESGSRLHTRVPRWLRQVLWLPVLTDFTVVVLFFVDVLDARVDAPWTTPVESASSVVFAVIITVGMLLAVRWVGVHRRRDKGDSGHYERPDGAARWTPRLELGVLGVLLAGVALVMLVRVLSDAQGAGVATGGVWVLATFLAAVVACVNWLVFVIEFADGSETTHELDHLGAQLKRVEERVEDLKAQLRQTEAALALSATASAEVIDVDALGPHGAESELTR